MAWLGSFTARAGASAGSALVLKRRHTTRTRSAPHSTSIALRVSPSMRCSSGTSDVRAIALADAGQRIARKLAAPHALVDLELHFAARLGAEKGVRVRSL